MSTVSTGHVVIAPDKFKGSLTAWEVSEAIATGYRRAAPDADLRIVPVADGGDGTVAAALASGYRSVPVRVSGPTGAPVDTEIALHRTRAVVELASASGLALLDELAPLTATSYGTGELITAAWDAGARTIVLGVGGSACTDGGAGMLSALGAIPRDADGNTVAAGGEGLLQVATLDTTTLDPRIAETDFILASDVDNPLLGSTGAAAVYGPQKGADEASVTSLERALTAWAGTVNHAVGRDVTHEPGAGAAGGVGYAALAVLNARRRAGTDILLELVGFDAHLPGARLVITGEGRLDEQTLHGKAPAGVAARALAAGLPVVAVTGSCALSGEQIDAAGITAVHSLRELEDDPDVSMRDAARLLNRLGERIAHDFTPR